ncbi:MULTISPECIES: hypothetical protein [Streptomyces]|uniref:Integral membrane protein n=1 Tax=Streptomyces luteosporeus TaxID=173856 RepID=A0ABP6G389_9ACTN
MATDAGAYPHSSRPDPSAVPARPTRESAAEALALAERTRAAVGSIEPDRRYGVALSLGLAGVYFSHLLPEPLDLVGLAAMYVGMLTTLVLQVRSSGVRHRLHPAMKRSMAVAAAIGLLTYLAALALEHWTGTPWIWVPAGLLAGGGVHVLDRNARTKGIPAQ